MADSCFFQAVVMLIIFLALPNPFEWATILQMAGLSIVCSIGNFMVNEAIVHGKAGPTSALCEIQSLWLLVLEVFILGKVPNFLQIIGFSLGIFGGSFIAFGSSSAAAH
jgi:drug/metabolite transporter (DMT)-like permease